jgi:hypothetical protein
MGACSAIYVQKLRDGKYHVWHGSTQVDELPAKPGEGSHVGAFDARGDALCAAHDAEGFSRTSDGVIELSDELAALDDARPIERWFITYAQAGLRATEVIDERPAAWLAKAHGVTPTILLFAMPITAEDAQLLECAVANKEHPDG